MAAGNQRNGDLRMMAMDGMARRPAAWRWIALGTLVFGTLDLLFAALYWRPKGVTLGHVLQSIASGWFGKQSRDMGTTSMAVGAVSHYVIAMMFVLAYVLVARRAPALQRRPVSLGIAYGVAMYLVMNFVVLPLSAAGMPSFDDTTWVVSSVIMHAVFGVICAYTARRALAETRGP